MKIWMKKSLSLLLVASTVLATTACKSGDSETAETGATDASGSGNTDNSGTSDASGTGRYTYSSTLGTIETWSPTDWSKSSENNILEYTTTVFYNIEMNETKDGYVFVPAAASAMPEDVTAEYAGNETYGVPADATEGYAWTVLLNEKLCWEDGTPITADDYLYSVEQYLSPDLKSYRASTYYDGSAALANAKAFYDGAEADYSKMTSVGVSADALVKGDDGVYTDESGNIAYLGWLIEDEYIYGYTLQDYASYFEDDTVELLESLVNEDGYIPLTDNVRDGVESIFVDWGDTLADYCYLYMEGGKWDYTKLSNASISADALVEGDDGVYTDADGNLVYLGWLIEDEYIYGYTLQDYASYFEDDVAELLESLVDENGYIALTSEVREGVESVFVSWGDTLADYCYVYKQSAATSFDSVGIVKNDDYSITFILTKPVSEVDFCQYVYVQLVKEDLYEQYKKDTGGLTKSTYGTSTDAFMSYGPYRIVSYQADKEMVLTRNENWYGYSEGEYYENLYQTTDIDLQVIDDSSTQFSMFLQGNLSKITLSADQMIEYANSDYIYYYQEPGTYFMYFNTDLEAVQKEDGNGVNHSIITILDFRKAVSLCLNREDLSQYMSGNVAAYGMINEAYLCSLESGISYRSTEQAKQALCNLYGVDDVSEITGYDLETARALFQSAYDEAIAQGLMSETDTVQIDFHAKNADSEKQSLINFIESSIQAACVGTDLEGKVSINLVADENYTSNMRAGLCDMTYNAWKGADTDPYWMMLCYCTEDYNYNYGFDVYSYMMTINVDGEDITMSAYDWYMALHETTYVTADLDTRNTILAGMEQQILEYYGSIPMTSYSYAILYEQRIILGSEEYINSLVGYGDSISQITYTMDDAAWAEYCASQNNQLTY